MRYLGGGVGHQATNHRVPIHQADKDPAVEGDILVEADRDDMVVVDDRIPAKAADVDEQPGKEDDENEGRVASEPEDGSDLDTSTDEDGENEDSEGDECFDPEDGDGAGEGLLAVEGYSDL